MPESLVLQTLSLIILALAGQFTHWLKRFARKETRLTFTQYMLEVNPRATLHSMITSAVAVIGITSTGADPTTLQTLSLAFLAGYTADSAINNGA